LKYNEALKFLYGLQKFGMKFGLQGISDLLASLGNPEKRIITVHIAGTNGKGSTASMIAAIYTAAGYRTGLYTSPHLLNFNERIRINGKPIESNEVSRLTSLIRGRVKANSNTFFEAVTAIAFRYFSDSNVDIAVIETGLGGRLDATNVIQPVVSVITSVGLEHTKILGSTIKKIAAEKGGIIKKGVPCVSGVSDKNAADVIRKICAKNGSEIITCRSGQITAERISLNGSRCDMILPEGKYSDLYVSLAGEHQLMNSLLAVTVARIAAEKGNFEVSEKDIREGLRRTSKLSGIEGRLAVIRKNPQMIIDVAHNPDAFEKLCRSIRRIGMKNINVVIGLMNDKDYRGIVRILSETASTAFIVKARTVRSMDASVLASEFRKYKIEAYEFIDVRRGIHSAMRRAGKTPVLIAGSHFVAAEALACLRGEKYLTINQ
jgi:dihydrofolate synthase / folylpolyglutamate synthase